MKDAYIEGLYRQSTNSVKNKFIERYKITLSIQAITMATILIFVLAVNFFDIYGIQRMSITNKLKKEFHKNTSYQDIIKNGSKIFDKIYSVISPIIPKSLQEYFTQKSKNTGKQVMVYNEINVEGETKTIKGVGAATQEKQDSNIITVASSVSTESEILEKLSLKKNKFIIPTKGTVSSKFGDREKIFNGVDSYHTGLDIAGNQGEKVFSSTDGKVTVADYNKYNGNYIEVTNGKIVTKYCHLEKRLVKVGEKVKAGICIGKMGSTGLSTGPHLHFEILYDGTRIDPQKVLNI